MDRGTSRLWTANITPCGFEFVVRSGREAGRAIALTDRSGAHLRAAQDVRRPGRRRVGVAEALHAARARRRVRRRRSAVGQRHLRQREAHLDRRSAAGRQAADRLDRLRVRVRVGARAGVRRAADDLGTEADAGGARPDAHPQVDRPEQARVPDAGLQEEGRPGAARVGPALPVDAASRLGSALARVGRRSAVRLDPLDDPRRHQGRSRGHSDARAERWLQRSARRQRGRRAHPRPGPAAAGTWCCREPSCATSSSTASRPSRTTRWPTRDTAPARASSVSASAR